MNCDLQLRTIRGGLEVQHLGIILSFSGRLIANQLTEIFSVNQLIGNVASMCVM